ncbi:unnamed protein product, partial [Vitis vinifera]
MSRCFPFPPPGYEKKTRSDDTDLLTKEKRKEKRHQKDKKDKDRRERKEKKDEERSKEKNREKKDRKEKKKDKKERNRDREKNRTSDEKRIEGKPASYNGEKPRPNNLPGVEISNSKIVQELGRRLGDKDKIVGSPMVQKVTLTDKGRPELEGSQWTRKQSSGNLGKRKEHETNGLFHENRMQPNKLPRPIASSDPIVENGWKSDPSQIITQFAPEKQVLPFNHKADIKEHKFNALAETQHSNSASMNSSSTTVQTTEKCEASAKQPHPDSKYLSQILSVPKIEECSNFDDQEWLFSSKNPQSKNMEVGSLGFDGTMQVWAEALPIKSADVSALPYVIPY